MPEWSEAELRAVTAASIQDHLGRAAQRYGARRGRGDHEDDRPDGKVVAPALTPAPLEVRPDLPGERRRALGGVVDLDEHVQLDLVDPEQDSRIRDQRR